MVITAEQAKDLQRMVAEGKLHPAYLEGIEIAVTPVAHTASLIGYKPPVAAKRDSVRRVLSMTLLSSILISLIYVCSRPSFNEEAMAQQSSIDSIPTRIIPHKDERISLLLKALVERVAEHEQRLRNFESNVSQNSVFTEPDYENLPVVKVTVVKALIRNAPSEKAPPLMAIPKDTTLTYAESSNEWFKVYTPSGKLGWISTKVVKPEAFRH